MDYNLNVGNAPIHHSEKVVNLHATAQKRGVTMWLGVLYSNMTQVLTIVIYTRHVAAGWGGYILSLNIHHEEKIKITFFLRYGVEITPSSPSSTTTG